MQCFEMCCIILYLCFRMFFKSRLISLCFFSSTFSALLQFLVCWRVQKAFSRILQRCRQRPLPALSKASKSNSSKASNISHNIQAAQAAKNIINTVFKQLQRCQRLDDTCKETCFTTGSMGQGSTEAALRVRKHGNTETVPVSSVPVSWVSCLHLCQICHWLQWLCSFDSPTRAKLVRQPQIVSNYEHSMS